MIRRRRPDRGGAIVTKWERTSRNLAEHVKHVTKVEPDGMHAELDIAVLQGRQLLDGLVKHVNLLDRAKPRNMHVHGRLPLVLVVPRRHEPRTASSAVTEHQFGLVRRREYEPMHLALHAYAVLLQMWAERASVGY